MHLKCSNTFLLQVFSEDNYLSPISIIKIYHTFPSCSVFSFSSFLSLSSIVFCVLSSSDNISGCLLLELKPVPLTSSSRTLAVWGQRPSRPHRFPLMKKCLAPLYASPTAPLAHSCPHRAARRAICAALGSIQRVYEGPLG